MKETVFFWFDYPPKVEKGAFNEFTHLWKGNVYYVFDNDLREERKRANWDDGDFGNATIIELYNERDWKSSILELLDNNKDAIHILNGFETGIVKKIKPFIFREGVKVMLFTERPAIMGGLLERIARIINAKYKYSRLYNEYKPYVKVFLPLGKQGVKRFRWIGVDEKQMYNFMYCPQLVNLSHKRQLKTNSLIRLLYVGRFYYKTKGTDVLMKAVRHLEGAWSLDLVGGYGKDTDKVMRQINSNPHVFYRGTWDSTQVVNNMQNYDIVVVPSKADGWNLCINEALHAGVAVISSNEAVSNEVIEQSKAGLIFDSGNYKDLAKKIQYAINNPEEVKTWAANGQRFVENITSSRVGRYFYDIIMYEFYNKGERPHCPWNKN